MKDHINFENRPSNYNFTKAIVSLPNGQSIEGPLVWWERFGNDQLVVKIGERIYLAHSENVILIGE